MMNKFNVLKIISRLPIDNIFCNKKYFQFKSKLFNISTFPGHRSGAEQYSDYQQQQQQYSPKGLANPQQDYQQPVAGSLDGSYGRPNRFIFFNQDFDSREQRLSFDLITPSGEGFVFHSLTM